MQKQWSCGCMEVDGQLVDECSQVKPAELLQSHQRSVYSPVCYRKEQNPPVTTESDAAGGEVREVVNTSEVPGVV